jgi:hypothetical protein
VINLRYTKEVRDYPKRRRFSEKKQSRRRHKPTLPSHAQKVAQMTIAQEAGPSDPITLDLARSADILGGLHPSIASLDLTQVRRKLMEAAPEGKGWTEENALIAERWYRRYLQIVLKYPGTRPVPNHQIDDFWHQHILDTRAYERDCKAIFGRFIHHNPYFGLNGDSEERDSCFDHTNALYRREFGEDCLSLAAQGKDCTAPCSTSACEGGGTCKPCTVDG